MSWYCRAYKGAPLAASPSASHSGTGGYLLLWFKWSAIVWMVGRPKAEVREISGKLGKTIWLGSRKYRKVMVDVWQEEHDHAKEWRMLIVCRLEHNVSGLAMRYEVLTCVTTKKVRLYIIAKFDLEIFVLKEFCVWCFVGRDILKNKQQDLARWNRIESCFCSEDRDLWRFPRLVVKILVQLIVVTTHAISTRGESTPRTFITASDGGKYLLNVKRWRCLTILRRTEWKRCLK